MTIIENRETREIARDSKSIPWQEIQEFYHKMVREKENITREFKDPHQYHFHDIEDIYHKLYQIARTYELLTDYHKIRINYADKNSICFSSFDQFSLRCASGSKAIKSIDMEYNFLIRHSQSGEEHNYKIVVNIISGLSLLKEIEEENIPRFVLKFGLMKGRAKVEFIDFAIGQNFMNTISSWFESRSTHESDKIIKFFQKRSHWIPIILRPVFLILAAYASYTIIPEYFSDSNNNNILAAFLVIAFSFTVVFSEVGFRLGKLIENSIDNISELAFIEINQGDKNLISESKAKNRKNIVAIACKSVVTIVFSMIPSILTHFLFN